MVIASIYATWALVLRATVIGQDAAAQAQRQRVVLRAIGDALMGVQSFQASQNYYWFKLANGTEPYLSFVARLPDTFPRHNKFVGENAGPDANERRVLFSLAPGANGEHDPTGPAAMARSSWAKWMTTKRAIRCWSWPGT